MHCNATSCDFGGNSRRGAGCAESAPCCSCKRKDAARAKPLGSLSQEEVYRKQIQQPKQHSKQRQRNSTQNNDNSRNQQIIKTTVRIHNSPITMTMQTATNIWRHQQLQQPTNTQNMHTTNRVTNENKTRSAHATNNYKQMQTVSMQTSSQTQRLQWREPNTGNNPQPRSKTTRTTNDDAKKMHNWTNNQQRT